MNDFEKKVLDIVSNTTWLTNLIDPNRTLLGIEYYSYSTNPDGILIGVAGGGADTATDTINIQADSAFALTYMSGICYISATSAANLAPNVLIQMNDIGAGKTFFSGMTNFPLVFGNNGLPFYLPAPRMIAAQSSIGFSLQNKDATNAYRVFISLLGAKIYYA